MLKLIKNIIWKANLKYNFTNPKLYQIIIIEKKCIKLIKNRYSVRILVKRFEKEYHAKVLSTSKFNDTINSFRIY